MQCRSCQSRVLYTASYQHSQQLKMDKIFKIKKTRSQKFKMADKNNIVGIQDGRLDTPYVCMPHMFGCPLYIHNTKYALSDKGGVHLPPIHLDSQYVWMLPCMFGSPICLDTPCMFGCSYVWIPPICLDAPHYVWIPHMFGWLLYGWMAPKCMEQPKVLAASKHMGHVKMYGAIKPYGGHPNMRGVQTYRGHQNIGVSKHVGHPNMGVSKHGGWSDIWGHPNIQGASKHEQCPNTLGASKHMGCPNIQGGHPNIWGCPNIWGIQTYRGHVCLICLDAPCTYTTQRKYALSE